MAAGRERAFLPRLLRESVLTLCRETMATHRQINIDGIVCITLDDDNDVNNNEDTPIVIRIHERLHKGRVSGSSPPLGSYYDGDDKPLRRESLLEMNSREFEARHNDVFVPSSSPESPLAPMPKLKQRRGFSPTSDLTAKVPRLEKECLRLDAYFPESRTGLRYDSSPSGDSSGREGSVSSTATLKRASTDSSASTDTSVSFREADHQTVTSPQSDADWDTAESAERGRRSSQASNGGEDLNRSERARVGASRTTPCRLPCQRCKTVLPSVLALERHNLQAHAMFTCNVCTSTFTARNNLKRHARMHSGVKPFKCGTCGAAFSRRDDLRTHEMRHAYGRPESLRRHQAYRCQLCAFSASGPLSLRKHLLKHTDREEFPCPPCGLNFNDPFVYTSHVKCHSSDPNFHDYLCCFCPKRLPTYELFVKHEKTHIQNPDTHECYLCSKQFRTAGHLHEHFATHEHQQSVEEGHYPGSDEQANNEQMPRLQRQDTPDRHAAQENCLQQYRDEDEMEARSGSSQPYWCTECHVGFQDENKLRQHIADTHEAVSRRHGDHGLNKEQREKGEPFEMKEDPRGKKESSDAAYIPESVRETRMDEEEEMSSTRAEEKSEDGEKEIENDCQETNRGEAKAGEERRTGNAETLKSLSMRHESQGPRDLDMRHPDARSTAASSTSSSAPTLSHFQLRTIPLIKVPLPLSAEEGNSVNGPDSPNPSRLSQICNNSLSALSTITTTSSSGNGSVMVLVKPRGFVIESDSYSAAHSSFSSSLLNSQHSDMKLRPNSSFSSSLLNSQHSDMKLRPNFLSGRNASGRFPNVMDHNMRRQHVENFLEKPNNAAHSHGNTSPNIKQEPMSDHEDSGSDRSSSTREMEFLSTRGQFSPSPDLPTDLSLPRPHSASPGSSGSGFSTNGDNGRSPGFEKVITPQVLFRAQSRFDCKMCEKHFLSFGDLESHSATEHRRFLCEYCGKSFTAKPNRDRHVRYHTGERPYRCPLCPQAFFRGDDLKYHRTTKHANVPISVAASLPPSAAPSFIPMLPWMQPLKKNYH